MATTRPERPARAPTAAAPAPTGWRPRLRAAVQVVARTYLRLWHSMELHGLEQAPPTGPLLVLVNHASLLDVPILMATDPYPSSALVVKASLFRIPVVREVLRIYNAIPVDRDGRDLAGLRAMLGTLRAGGVVGIAAEGRRTRSGRLEPVHPVLARLAVQAQVPLIAVGIGGSFAALPPGALFPRRRKVIVRIGKPFRLPRGMPEDEAAVRIRAAIAELLPPEQRPLEGALPAPHEAPA